MSTLSKKINRTRNKQARCIYRDFSSEEIKSETLGEKSKFSIMNHFINFRFENVFNP